MSTALAQYDAMRLQVRRCARVDEAAEIRNKADKLRAYAKQKKDHELHRWMGEIFCRATLRFGELSKDLDKAKPGGAGGGAKVPPVGRSKAEQLKAAGISKSAAQRAEALVGARSDLDDEMAVEALGISLDKTTPNHRQLTSVVEQALNDRFGKPKHAPRKPKRSALSNAFIDWTGAVTALATLEVNLRELAEHALCSANDLEDAEKASARLQQWLEMMEEKYVGLGSGNVGTRIIRESMQAVPPA